MSNTMEVNKLELDIPQLEKDINKRFLEANIKPKNVDHILGGFSYVISGRGSYQVRSEPLFMFNKNCYFRTWCENILKEFGLFDKYTIIYNSSIEWYDYLTIISKDKYAHVSL